MQSILRAESRIDIWKAIALGLCFSVFLFSWNVRLAKYQPPSPNVSSLTAAKLWVDLDPVDPAPALEILALLLFTGLCLQGPTAIGFEPADITSAPKTLLWLRRTFLRPPPSI
jgi:hypothetical protein